MDPYAPVHFLFAALCHLAPSVDGNDGEVSQCTAHVSRPSLFLSIRRYRQSRPGFCSDFSSRRKIGPPSSSLFLSLSLSLSLSVSVSLFFFLITRRMRTFRTVGVRRTTPKKNKTKQEKCPSCKKNPLRRTGKLWSVRWCVDKNSKKTDKEWVVIFLLLL